MRPDAPFLAHAAARHGSVAALRDLRVDGQLSRRVQDDRKTRADVDQSRAFFRISHGFTVRSRKAFRVNLK